MSRKIALLAALFVFALAVTVSLFTAPRAAAQGASCQAQCKVQYDTCVRAATNPGGLNQCRKANQACLANCH